MTTIQFAADAAATPISKLRQAAKELSRKDGIKLSEALDRVAHEAIGAPWDRLMATAWTLTIPDSHGRLLDRAPTIRRQLPESLAIRVEPLVPSEDPYALQGLEKGVSVVRHLSREGEVDLETVILRLGVSYEGRVPLRPEVAAQLIAAKSAQAACAAWILAYADLRDRIPDDFVTFDTPRAVAAGLVSGRGPDQDGHARGLRLQRFTGADGSVSWRVSLRDRLKETMHPDLYIPAGQIEGALSAEEVVAELKNVIGSGGMIQLSRNGFYMPHGVGVPFAVPLSRGTVLATVGLPWFEEEARTFEAGDAKTRIRTAHYRVESLFSRAPLIIEDASHLGRDVPEGPDELEMWQWGLNGVLPHHHDSNAISKMDTRRPNARMRYLDHHLLRGLTDLVAMTMKYPVGEAEKAPRTIKNNVYLWSGAEHTNGSNEEEPFKWDCNVFHARERREKNRNARSLFIMEAMDRMVAASYIALPQTIELRRQIGLMSAYYRKLAKGQVSDLKMG
jgi:hypothetical protein